MLFFSFDSTSSCRPCEAWDGRRAKIAKRRDVGACVLDACSPRRDSDSGALRARVDRLSTTLRFRSSISRKQASAPGGGGHGKTPIISDRIRPPSDLPSGEMWIFATSTLPNVPTYRNLKDTHSNRNRGRESRVSVTLGKARGGVVVRGHQRLSSVERSAASFPLINLPTLLCSHYSSYFNFALNTWTK